MGHQDFRKCIEACLKRVALCNHHAASSIQEKDVKIMSLCLQMDMECAVAPSLDAVFPGNIAQLINYKNTFGLYYDLLRWIRLPFQPLSIALVL